jgi:hypothetical protein
MPELTIQQINDIYTAENLTPVLVVKAGGDSYGHTSSGDYDYFGYHLEDVQAKDNDEFLYRDAEVDMRSWPVNLITKRLAAREGPKRAMWCIDHWLWHTPLVTTDPQYTTIKAQIVNAKEDEWMRFYAYSALSYFKAWKKNASTKTRNIAVRIALTVKYYQDYGTLECDFSTLLTEYPIGTDEERATLKAELKQLYLEMIADRIPWSILQ